MPETSLYEIPYLEPGDRPDIPAVSEGIAEAVEAELQRIDADIAGRARGLVAWAERTTASTPSGASETGVLRLSASLALGRQYKIWASPLHMDSSATNDEIFARIRYNPGGTATTASSTLPGAVVHTRQTDANVSDSKSISVTYTPGSTQTISLLLTVGKTAGSGNVSIGNTDAGIGSAQSTQLVVEDIGPAIAQTGVSL